MINVLLLLLPHFSTCFFTSNMGAQEYFFPRA